MIKKLKLIKSLAKFHNFVHHDVLINLSVVLAGGESERCGYEVVLFETHPCLFAENRGYITVGILTAQLLKDDVTFADLASFGLLRWHGECVALCRYSVKVVRFF